MSLPVQQFPILTPEQMSPYGNLLKNSLARFTDIQNARYLPKEKEQALQKAIYENMKAKPYAEMAPQFAKSELELAQLQPANLQARTQGQLINNEWQPRLNQSTIAHQGAQTARSNQLLPYDVARQGIENKLKDVELQYAPETAQANINKANLLGMGGVGAREESLFQSLVAKDNPQLQTPEQVYEASNVLREGGNKLSDGTELKPLSPAAQASFNRITKGATTTVLYNQAAQLGDLTSQLKELDIKPAQKFTGIKGNLDIRANKAKAAIGQPVSKDYLDYVAYQNTVIANMDSMRKALATTVQPKYVKEFLGELTNPNSNIWNNPETVRSKYDATIKWAENHEKNIKTKAIKGINSTSQKETEKFRTYNLQTGKFE